MRILTGLLLPALLAAWAHPAAAQAAEEPAAELAKRCSASDVVKERRCYEAVLAERLAGGGPAPALALLDALAALDRDVARDGHMYAHGIGIAALTDPAEVGRVFERCTPAHMSGCYHGVIQAYFLALQRSGSEISTTSVDALCADWRGKNDALLFQCVHGLGHGLAILHGHDLKRALASCDLLSASGEQEMCYAGAFMENIVNVTHPHHAISGTGGKAETEGAAHSGHGEGHEEHDAAPQPAAMRALDKADLHYPCSALDEKYLIACYTMQTSAMLFHTGEDVGRTAAECGKAPEVARATCFLSLGRDVSALAAGSTGKAIDLCGLAEAKYRPACHTGVVESLINMNADPAEGLPYCRALADVDAKRACYAAVGGQALVFPDGTARREQACRKAEREYVTACLGRPAEGEAPTGA